MSRSRDITASHALRTIWGPWTDAQLGAYQARMTGIHRRLEAAWKRNGDRWERSLRIAWERRLQPPERNVPHL